MNINLQQSCPVTRRATITLFSLLILLLAACRPVATHPLSKTPSVRFVTVTPQPSPTPVLAVTPAPQASLTLQDVTTEAGLTFQHGAFKESLAKDPVAMMGGGLCWLDFDQDGWLDLYVVNSHALHEIPLWEAQGSLPRNALFRNQGDGTFSDVSPGSGADLALRGNGCIATDIDQDGDTDIYITADGPNALLLNQGNGQFVEGAAAAGIDAPEWNTAAAMTDIDGDGLIDLYVASYIDLTRKIPTPIGLFPQDYYGLPDHLYKNMGDGTFSDIAFEAGLTEAERGSGALFSDFDRDGDPDLYIANDGHPNRLYLNQGDGTFSDISHEAGVDDRGSGMGVSAGDYSGDGWPDLVVTNFDKEYNALYKNRALPNQPPQFQYATFRMGIQGFGQNQTGWGITWLDLDLDTDLDLLTAQGKVPITDLKADSEIIRYYRNRGDGTFRDNGRLVGLQEIGPRMARGMAQADYDNDGDMDVALATIAGPLSLLQTNGTTGNWLIVNLPTFTPGALLQATLPDGRVLTRELHCGNSYLSSEDPRFHLGLGNTTHLSHLEITLPGGQQFKFKDVAANQIFHIGG